jgi:hypothetical protein
MHRQTSWNLHDRANNQLGTEGGEFVVTGIQEKTASK